VHRCAQVRCVDLEALDAPFNVVLFDAQDLIKFGGTVIKDTLFFRKFVLLESLFH
jgi:hypothetical protein